MRRIFKYPLAIRAYQHVVAPLAMHTQIVAVQMQGEHACLWAIVDDSETRKERVTIQIVGTGHELPPSCTSDNHIGTVQGDGFVWHVFMVEANEIGRSGQS